MENDLNKNLAQFFRPIKKYPCLHPITNILELDDLLYLEKDPRPLLTKLILLTDKYHNLENIINEYIRQSPNKINKIGKTGWPALHYACERNCRTRIVKMLLENGANINFKSSYGSTAIYISLVGGYDKLLFKLLLEYDAHIDINIKYCVNVKTIDFLNKDINKIRLLNVAT